MAGEDIPVAANVLGTIGTVFWCIQLVPQIWHNWRHKKTDGLPASMMLLWAICMAFFIFDSVYIWRIANVCICAGSVPFGVYMIVQVCLYNDLRSYMDVNWRINLCLECQYSPADPAADIWLLWFYQLGSDIILSRVSLLLVYVSTASVANLYI